MAEAAGIKKAEFKKCIAEGRGAERVNVDLEEATNAGIGDTPAFFNSDGK